MIGNTLISSNLKFLRSEWRRKKQQYILTFKKHARKYP